MIWMGLGGRWGLKRSLDGAPGHFLDGGNVNRRRRRRRRRRRMAQMDIKWMNI